MADFGGMVLTKLGLNLLAKGQTGAAINITRAAAGAGVWPDTTNAEAVTALVDERLSVPIQGMSVQGDGTIKLTVVISNSGLEAGFIFRELGVFATDPDLGEILYAVAYSGDRYDYLPASATTVEKILDIYIVVGGAQNVTATISPGAVIALKSDIEDHDAASDAHTVALAAHNADASANSAAIAAHEAKDPAHPARHIGFDNSVAKLPGDPARTQSALESLAGVSEGISSDLAAHEAADPAHAASHISFDNATANLPGAPDRVQKAIEALGASMALVAGVLPGSVIAFSGEFGGTANRCPIPRGATEPDTGWRLCDGGDDGNGGTVPDLRDRMILGASDTHPAGTTGGTESHAHDISGSVGATTLTIEQMPYHSHSYPYYRGSGGESNPASLDNNATLISQTNWATCTGGSQAHSHSLSTSSGTASSLPPYYAMAYIILL